MKAKTALIVFFILSSVVLHAQMFSPGMAAGPGDFPGVTWPADPKGKLSESIDLAIAGALYGGNFDEVELGVYTDNRVFFPADGYTIGHAFVLYNATP